ncbi:MoaD/ThiS family protein [Chloroflexota bacterium]
MGKVQLKMLPWIASMLNKQSSGWFILEKEIGEGTTIGGLLADLASSHTGFRKVVFNPDAGKIGDQVIIFLNDSHLQDSDVAKAKLNDGDIITLVHVYAGG